MADSDPDLAGDPLAVMAWIGEHPELFRPPVSNRVLFEDSQLIVMVVAGPNVRNDFHIDIYSEVFLQLRGSIRVDTRVGDETVAHIVDEGELFVVPGGTPHSPRRPADTWGLVIERRRNADDMDVVTWFCPRCGAEVNRTELPQINLERDLGPVLEAFATDDARRTCPVCGAVHPVAEPIVV